MCMDPAPTFVRLATFGQLAEKTFSIMLSRPSLNQIQGKIANTLAGKPEPLFGFGKLTTVIAPASGT